MTTPETPVVDAVQEYLRGRISRMPYFPVSMRREYPIFMGSSKRKADIAVYLSDDSVFVIAECKAPGKVAGGHDQLKSYLCASDTPYGIFANSLESTDWTFYKNRGQNAFTKITRSVFQELFSDWGDAQSQGQLIDNWLTPIICLTIELLTAKSTLSIYEQKLLETLNATETDRTLDQQKIYDDWTAFVSFKKRDALLEQKARIKEEQALLKALQAQYPDTPRTIQSITDPQLAIQLFTKYTLEKHVIYDVIRGRLRQDEINKLTSIVEETRISDAPPDLIEAVVLQAIACAANANEVNIKQVMYDACLLYVSQVGFNELISTAEGIHWRLNVPSDLLEAVIDVYKMLTFAWEVGIDEVNRLHCKLSELSTSEDLDNNDADLLYLFENAYDVIVAQIDNN